MQNTGTLHRQCLYGQLANRIRASIAAGEFAEGRLPTESQLCAQYGVSVATVRRAVRELVAEGLVRRRQGAGTFVAGWRARPTPRARRSLLLAYISGAGSETVPGSFFNALMLASQRAAESLGYSTVLANASAESLPMPLRKRRVDAAILAGTFRDPRHAGNVPATLDAENMAYLRALAQSRLPVVSISNHGDWPAVHRVLPDYDDALDRAVALLADAGHRRIALWGGPFSWPAFGARLRGFERAVAARGLSREASAVVPIDDFAYRHRQRYCQELADWLAQHRETTALVAVSGPAALVARAAKSAGRTVPDDLSIVALTDVRPPEDPNFHFEDPDEEVPTQLAAFVMPVDALATAAVERAVRLAEGRPIPEAERTQAIPLTYCAGRTVGACPPKRP